jgi:hypothetical protein
MMKHNGKRQDNFNYANYFSQLQLLERRRRKKAGRKKCKSPLIWPQFSISIVARFEASQWKLRKTILLLLEIFIRMTELVTLQLILIAEWKIAAKYSSRILKARLMT